MREIIMTISLQKGLLIFGALAVVVVLGVLALNKPSQAEEPVLGPGYRTANLDIEGMT